MAEEMQVQGERSEQPTARSEYVQLKKTVFGGANPTLPPVEFPPGRYLVIRRNADTGTMTIVNFCGDTVYVSNFEVDEIPSR